MTSPTFKLLIVPLVEQIHEAVLLKHGGGKSGVFNPGLLDSSIQSVELALGYQALNVFEVAAKYAYKLIKNHCFNDGNKRTAVAATLTFLQMNGIVLNVDPDVFTAVAVQVACNELEEVALAEWFAQHAEQG